MSVKSILKLGDPRLREICTPIEDISSAKVLYQDLNDTMDHIRNLYEFSRGSGLSAPQIGSLQRAIVIQYEGERRILVNPEIIEASEEKAPMREGCLSFFDFRGTPERHTRVKVRARDENGDDFELEGTGDLASLLQHEIDHLDGILYFDRMPGGEMSLLRIENMPLIP